jgi:hypothetical protein
MSAGECDPNSLPANASGDADSSHVPQHVPAAPNDPDLARVIATWPDLPPHIKAAVLALVGTAPHP